MQIEKKKEKNTEIVRLKKRTNGILNPKSKNEFKYQQENLIITKFIKKEEEAKYTLIVRKDGKDENEGQSIISQIVLTNQELIKLRNEINELVEE